MFESGHNSTNGPATPMLAGRRLLILASLLVVVVASTAAYALRQRSQARELATSRDQMKSALAQTRTQYEQLAARLDALATERKAEQAAAAAAALDRDERVNARRARVVRVASSRRAAPDPRWKKIEGQLAEQQKQIAGTQDELRSAREELQTTLNSTRDELTGSIARNHDELVELQKRGERNYYEFDLAKSKQFQRTGPISLSLRKADTKHKRFDLALLVEDAQVQKKGVNVYEPVLIYLPDRPQALELVVNQVAKNQVKGYLSEPRYKKSELTPTASVVAPQQEPGLRRR